MLYFRLSKNKKIKVLESMNRDFVILLSQKYSVFYSKNLHNDTVQHWLHLSIFSELFEKSKFKFSKL
jgi:hypothetical protein